jgi:hypothetical protein
MNGIRLGSDDVVLPHFDYFLTAFSLIIAVPAAAGTGGGTRYLTADFSNLFFS